MTAVAASDSSTRSASTLRISGWSARALPNALRWVAWWTACVTPYRMPEAEPMTQSSRVMLTISMMVLTPRPSSPTRWATAPSYSTSAEALDLLPSLSFSRMIRMALREPSGSTRGSRKHESPPGACASTRKTSHMGAELNHLWPVIAQVPSPSGSALVVFARTSEPPCFSVIAIPASTPRLAEAGRRPKS